MNKVVENKVSGSGLAAKVIAIIVFAMVMSALAIALTSDFLIFAQQIFGFIIACLASIAAFIMGFILMIFSIVLVFGIFILKEYGFWPISWASQTFKEVLSDYKITQEQLVAFRIVRIVLIVICILAFIGSIVALIVNKTAPKESRAKISKPFGILSLIFSILGLLAAIGMISIITIIS